MNAPRTESHGALEKEGICRHADTIYVELASLSKKAKPTLEAHPASLVLVETDSRR